MHRLSNPNVSAFFGFGGIAIILLALANPLLSFVVIFGAWSGLRWPSTANKNPYFDVGSAENISEAFYEALWAAILSVGGIIIIFEFMKIMLVG